MSEQIRIERFTGQELAGYIPEVARLRLTVFRDFPYLYDGTAEYEQRYLSTYTSSPASVVVVAFDRDRPVGAATAIPLADETQEVQRPFRDAGMDPERVFYLGESVLLPAYRGRGVGVRFFEERESHARFLGGFDWYAFCAVERPADHPRRPVGYVPLDAFWEHRGYRRRPDLQTRFSWRDLNEADESEKPMVFWLKAADRDG